MASNLVPFLLHLLLCLASAPSFSSSSPSPQRRRLLQSDSPPRNIETTFPSLPSPAFQNPPPPSPLPSLAPPPPPLSPPPPSSDSRVRTAVAVTAASSIGLCSVLFLVFLFFSAKRRKVGDGDGDSGKGALQGGLRSKPKLQPSGSLIVDENGLDAIYWREFNEKRCRFCQNVLDSGEEESDGTHGQSPPMRNDRRIQEKPLLPTGSINSSSKSFVSEQNSASRSFALAAAAAARSSKHAASSDQQSLPPPPARLKSSSSRSPPLQVSSPSPPPPPPPRNSNAAPAPPPPPPPVKKSNAVAAPAPPPPPPVRTSNSAPSQPPSAPPPPPPGGGRGGPSARPPPVPPQWSAAVASEAGQKKMKPLHWDKVNPVNAQHSMVWDKINTDGSFNFDEEIMEALFGTLVTNRKAAEAVKGSGNSSGIGTPGTPTAQISLLDSRKSQNIAIVLRSLALSRQDILDALVDGRSLPADVLERLTKIAPTKEEEALVRSFDGNPTKLADAESFLFHVLRAVPSPFVRFEAMLFRCNYEHEIAHLKQSLQTLEMACKELKSRGLFLKLLEAVLKAGNLMNAGTARGNAQAFNLSALCKLSDVKSTDGSTTLLHFVVEEVIRSEGKRLVVSRNYSLRQQSGGGSGQALDRTTSRGGGAASREEREKEYTKLGLPIVGGISDEFASAKKAAGIDYDALSAICSSLGARLAEIRLFLDSCGGDGFAREMKPFVEAAEEELRAARAEQARIMELVKSTTEYYQPGASKERRTAAGHPLQLFIIVRDFLNMVDKACVDIARNVQKRKPAAETGASAAASKPGPEGGRKPMARFPYLPPNFMSENSRSESSSDDEDDDRP